jgi:hypothetical protein
MDVCKRLLVLIAVAFIFLGAGSVAQASPTIIGLMPGSWTCTSHGSMGTSSRRYIWTRVNAYTLQSAVHLTSGTQRASVAATLFYDAKQRQYVFMAAGTGGWFVSQATAGPDATTLHWTDTYPANRNNGWSTDRFSNGEFTMDRTWRRNGRVLSQFTHCTKS